MTDTENIRNIALVGHNGSGKTTLAESLAFVSGIISKQSSIREGHTISDFDPEEIKRKISISTSLLPINWKNHKINILDTPGYADLFGEVEVALDASENAIVLIDAIAGTQVQTNKVLNTALEKGLTSFFFISRLDKEHAKFNEVLSDIHNLTSSTTVAAFLPIGIEANLRGIIDLIAFKAYSSTDKEIKEIPIPKELKKEADEKREKLIEAAAENDDVLLEKYLEKDSLEQSEILKGLKIGLKEGKLKLIFCGSATKNVGITNFLDYIVKLTSSPLEREPLEAFDNNNKLVNIKISTNTPFSAFVFKTISNPYVGKLSYLKVVTGKLKKDQPIVNVRSNKKYKVSHIFEIKGKEQKEISEISAGDIGALPKLEEVKTTDTIAAENNTVKYNVIKIPESVLSFAIAPKNENDDEKLSTALTKITNEDPTIIIRRETQTKETVISGMGDMHLEIVTDRLKQRFGIEATLKAPKIPYRETLKKTTKAQGKYKKQTGGRGQYGDVWLRLEPLERGKQYEFLNEIKGGVVPSGFIPAVQKGIAETIEKGVIAGYPVVDVKVALYDGSYHPVDSSEMAFKIATSMAFKEAFKQANPTILEPMMNIEVHVPEIYVGDVIGNLSSKRGRVQGTEASGKYHVINAQVPLSEISQYAIELRSITHGEGDFIMSFSHYEETAPDIRQKIIAKAKEQKANTEH